MNAVAYYSPTGQSKAIAEFFSERLGYPLVDIESSPVKNYHSLVLVFPVHCQNLPNAVKGFLRAVTVTNLTAVATYGKMCCGNVLYEIQTKYRKNLVAGAFVPTKHSYVAGDQPFCDFGKLIPVAEKAQNPSPLLLPRLYKNPFASLFPALRSRLGVRIVKTADCSSCNACSKACSLGAISLGKTNGSCIRCLKCVRSCPRQALKIKLSLPMRLYLNKKKSNEVIVYV